MMVTNRQSSRPEERKNWFQLLGLLALGLAAGANAWGVQSLALGWDPSTTPGVKGYFVYYGTNGNLSTKLNVGSNLTATIPNLNEGQVYSFAVTAYDSSGTESNPSPSVSYVIPENISLLLPATPGDPMVVQFSMVPGHTYQVQATEDFQTWTNLWSGTVTTNQVFQYTDTQTALFDKRFYRVAVQ